MNLSVLNIDEIILEEAATSFTMCAVKIREAINTAFIEKFEGSEILGNYVEGEELSKCSQWFKKQMLRGVKDPYGYFVVENLTRIPVILWMHISKNHQDLQIFYQIH